MTVSQEENARLSSAHESSISNELVLIKNLINGNDRRAVEAVLSCIDATNSHIAPHGQLGPRLNEAENMLAHKWKYSLKGRTMLHHATTLLDLHALNPNRTQDLSKASYNRDRIEVTT